MLVGFDADLAAEATRLTNRLRGLLTRVHPALERVLGPRLHTKVVLALLSRYGGPAGLRAAGQGRLLQTARKADQGVAAALVDQLQAALAEQTVVVPGTTAAETVLPELAVSLRDTLDQRAALAAQVEQVLDAHPLAAVLTRCPAPESGPQPASCSRSATPAPFPPPGTSPPTPVSPLGHRRGLPTDH